MGCGMSAEEKFYLQFKDADQLKVTADQTTLGYKGLKRLYQEFIAIGSTKLGKIDPKGETILTRHNRYCLPK